MTTEVVTQICHKQTRDLLIPFIDGRESNDPCVRDI